MKNITYNRADIIRDIFIRYYPDEKNYKEIGTYSSLSNLDYDEEEVTFHDFITKIKADGLSITKEDKELIDEIGESLWNDGDYWQHRMKTKYWKDIV